MTLLKAIFSSIRVRNRVSSIIGNGNRITSNSQLNPSSSSQMAISELKMATPLKASKFWMLIDLRIMMSLATWADLRTWSLNLLQLDGLKKSQHFAFSLRIVHLPWDSVTFTQFTSH